MPSQPSPSRRSFLGAGLGAAAGLALGGRAAGSVGSHALASSFGDQDPRPSPERRVVLVRYGGGVRRRETIDPDHSQSPYLRHRLVPRGVLFDSMEIDAGVETSHGQGTLHLLTGRYDGYVNRAEGFLGEQFEPTVPTLFEGLRKDQDVARHQTLMVNNENRLQEEYFTASTHPHYGVDVRAETLSMHRFRLFRVQEQLRKAELDDAERAALERRRDELLKVDPRAPREAHSEGPLREFWEDWRRHFGDELHGAPRGDRLLTELSVWALRRLRPRLMSIHYTDPDYVHWGNPAHYTRGIEAIDQGLRRLVECVEADEELRAQTCFVVVPDCGRDHNRLMQVPHQHHFGSKESRRIWALFFGPGIATKEVVDRRTEQVEVARTVAELMGFRMEHAKGQALAEVWA